MPPGRPQGPLAVRPSGILRWPLIRRVGPARRAEAAARQVAARRRMPMSRQDEPGESMMVAKFGIGQPMRRVEDPRLIKGGGRYTDDYRPEGCLSAVVLRSPHAHARFTVADVEAARAMPGVRAILTAEDVAHLGDVPCLAPIDRS